MTASVKNGARQAAQASITLRYLDFPLDPRTIRACAVSVYIGTLTQEEFQQGLAGQTRGGIGGPAEPLTLVPSTYVDDDGNQRTNLRFQGWADTIELDWPDDGEPTVKFECRDNTTLLDAQDHPPKVFLDMKKPIHEAIATYLANFNQFAGMSVEYRPSGATPPSLDQALSKTSFRPNLGPSASKGGGGEGQKTSAHDYLTDCCGAIGHIIRLEGTNLIVQEADHRFTAICFVYRDDDPFKGRNLPRLPQRSLYGSSILNAELMKAPARRAVMPTNIEVRCYLPEKKTTLVGRFPDPKNASNSSVQNPKPGDSKEQKWSVHYVSGIMDQATLNRVAQGYYEMQGRGEIEAEVKTKNLASFGGGNLDIDILDMEAGDTFEVLTNRSDDEMASVTQIETLLLAQGRVQQFMSALGYDDAFSAGYAKSFTNVAFPTLFKLRHLGIAWDCDEGVGLTLNGVNYVEVRLDQQLPSGQEVAGGKGGSKATGGP